MDEYTRTPPSLRPPELPPAGDAPGSRLRADEPVSDPDGVVEAAQFPRGFWAGLDYMLHHPAEIRKSLATDTNLWALSRVLFTVSLAMSALYGAVMGATNLLQGSAMPLQHRLAMIPITGIKVPVLFLVTLAIVLPPIYVSNAFAGARLTFRRVLASMLASLAITSTALASMATVAFFFSLTSRSYDFIKLLHVLFFVYGGLMGLSYLSRHVRLTSPRGGAGISRRIAVLWLFLYMFVGTQLAWVLRPFMGSPGEAFQVFRQRSGSFYESVYDSAKRLMQVEGKR
jgi:hypothetical protein